MLNIIQNDFETANTTYLDARSNKDSLGAGKKT